MKVLIELIVSFASTVGFGLVTNVPRRSLLPAGITGSLAWVAYYLVLQVDNGLILPTSPRQLLSAFWAIFLR